MWIAAILTALAGSTIEFDLDVVPLRGDQTQVFLASENQAGSPSLFILDAETLRILPGARAASTYALDIPANTSAIDVSDINGDGLNELIGVAEENVFSLELTHGAHSPNTLLSCKTLLTGYSESPFTHVLVSTLDNNPVIALPTDQGLELWSPQGELLQTLALSPEESSLTYSGRPFTAYPVIPPQIGRPDEREFRVTALVAAEPLAPMPDSKEFRTPASPERPSPLLHAEAAASRPPQFWPWFGIHQGEQTEIRALYALEYTPESTTTIRVHVIAQEQGDVPGEFSIGPPRRFPGAIVLLDGSRPDFNADGNVDLLLWRATTLRPTVGVITGALAEGAWEIYVTPHLFQPDKNRFEARSAGAARINMPIDWLLPGTDRHPLRHAAIDDFNGDGRSDFACAVDAHTLAVWLSGERGLSPQPDNLISLPSPISDLLFHLKFEINQGASLVLRAPGHLYIVRPRSAA